MPDRPPENPAQPEHIRRPGSASSIFQPKAMPSKSGRSVRRPSLRRREGCRRPRPKQTAYHPPEARREAPCPPPPAFPPGGEETAHRKDRRLRRSTVRPCRRTDCAQLGTSDRGAVACPCSPPTRQRGFRPDGDPEYRLRGDTRRPTGRVLHNPEISPFLYSGIGFVPFRSRRGAASERSYLRKRLSRERVPVRRPLPPDCPVHRPGTDTSQRAGLRRGGDFRSRPHRTGRQFRRFAPGRPSCTALAGGADTSVGERQLPQHNGRSIRLIAEHGLSTTGKRRPRPSPRANESRRSEKRALPHPTRFRSEAAHSRRRLRPPGGSGSVSNRAEKTNRSRPAPYHRRLSRSRPSTHTRPRPVTSNGKQRKQGRPTNLLPPLPENLLFGENTKTVTIEKRLSEIRQTASFRSGSGTTRNRTGDTRIFSPLLYQLSYGTININAYVS